MIATSMFVLPPTSAPGRYPNSTNPWVAGVSGSAPAPIIETNNTISTPKGSEHQFSVGEGTYVLREDIHLGMPNPHPTEPPQTNANPLSTAPQPMVAGTKISLVQIKSRNAAIHLYRTPEVPNSKDTYDSGSRTSGGDTDDESSTGKAGSSSQASKNGDVSHVPEKFGGGNTLLAAPGGRGMKKPKNSIVKSHSSFVSRIQTHDHLSKRLAERNDEDLFVFANINRAFHWLDLGSKIKQEPLSKILFTKAHPICHDVNTTTRSASHLDVIIGFSSGDIIWFDPISNKYARINKNGTINSHAVTEIKWLPGSDNLFLAAHNDGSLIVYDKEKEDTLFVPESRGTSSRPPTRSNQPIDEKMTFFGVLKSVKSTNQKTNPVSYWSVAKGPITAFSFSPDCEHLAVVSEDQCLRVISFVKEKLLDVYISFYGGLICVCWSPDGHYIVTGGQDDLVSIWSMHDRRIIARCEGHHSWVSSVAFDPWRCDDRTYRFGSVGHDCRLLLWDFSVGMLHKPKAAAAPHRSSITSTSRMPSTVEDAPIVHAVDSRATTAVLPPVMSKEVDEDPLTMLIFREDCIMTTCVGGHIRTWDRPVMAKGESEVTLSAASAGG